MAQRAAVDLHAVEMAVGMADIGGTEGADALQHVLIVQEPAFTQHGVVRLHTVSLAEDHSIPQGVTALGGGDPHLPEIQNVQNVHHAHVAADVAGLCRPHQLQYVPPQQDAPLLQRRFFRLCQHGHSPLR